MTVEERILQLKKEKNAVILAHYYVKDELQGIADYTGDSFYLSEQAAKSDADVIVFCGVRFMGESAKILSPGKTVYLPFPTADCPMAHMASVSGVKKIREEVEDVAVVCYINSTAELKAVSDVCVTSSNALKIVRALPQKNVYFIPDGNLGRYVESLCPEKTFYFSDGCCPVHAALTAADAERAKAAHPGAKLLVHPECRAEVTALADYVGSTKGMIEYASASEEKTFVVGTEEGILCELKKRNPDKEFFFITSGMVCPDMKKIELKGVVDALEGKLPEVTLSDREIEAAKGSLTKMLELGK